MAIIPWLLFLLFARPACLAGEGAGPAATPRQLEILNQLLTFHPPGYAGDSPWMLERWDTESGLTAFLRLPTGPGNAASAFKRLEDFYESEKEEIETGGADSFGVRELLDAAAMGSCALAPDYYPVFDRVTARQPDFVVLRKYLQALFRRAERAERRADAAEAERCYGAAVICGWHLARDRNSALVYMTGVIFQMRGAQGLEAFYRRSGDIARADAVKRHLERLQEILRLFHWKANVALSELDGFAGLPAIIRIAAADKEVCWRKEAVSRLAVLRHGVPDVKAGVLRRNPDFERAAEEALSAVASRDPDPAVRRLAVWAALNVNPGDGVFRHVFE